VDALPDTRLSRHIAGQLVRSGTAPAPNYAEACAAETEKAFIHVFRFAFSILHFSLYIFLATELLGIKRSD
jgi:four helix bundle protein